MKSSLSQFNKSWLVGVLTLIIMASGSYTLTSIVGMNGGQNLAETAQATPMSLSELIDLLVSSGVISSDKAADAKLLASDSVGTVVVSTTSVAQLTGPRAVLTGIKTTLNTARVCTRRGVFGSCSSYSNNEVSLTGEYTLTIQAKGNPIILSSNSNLIGTGMAIYEASSSNYTGVSNGAPVLTSAVGAGGDKILTGVDANQKPIYTIPAGSSAIVKYTTSVNPKQLFAGTYRFGIVSDPQNIVYQSAKVDSGHDLPEVRIPFAISNGVVSNSILVIGETSPYISNVVASTTNSINVTGARLSSFQTVNIVCNDGTKISLPVNYNRPTAIGLNVGSAGLASSGVINVGQSLPASFCNLEIVDPQTGASNHAYFEIKALITPVTDPKPIVTNINSSQLSINYDSTQKESAVTATFNIAVTAGDKDLYVYQHANPVKFTDQNNSGHVIFGNATTSLSQLSSPTGAGVSSRDQLGQIYWKVPAGQQVMFNVVSSVNPKIMFAGPYVAEFSSIIATYGDAYNAFSINSYLPNTTTPYVTSPKVIIGETSPYIDSASTNLSQSSVYPGSVLNIEGARFTDRQTVNIKCDNDSKAYAILPADKNQFPYGFRPEATGKYAHVLVGATLPASVCIVQVVDPSNGASNIVSLNVTGTTTTPTTAGYAFTRDLLVGSQGEDVTALQQALNQLPATGFFGALTKVAVIKFQTDNGIAATGVVDAPTRQLLNKMTATTQQSSITVTSPNGGEIFNTGNTVNISWTSKNISTSTMVIIELSFLDNDGAYAPGRNILDLISEQTPNIGSYRWTIPEFYSTGVNPGSFTVKVSAPGVTDSSDGVFTIRPGVVNTSLSIASPITNSVNMIGNNLNISWSSDGKDSYALFLLKKGDPSFEKVIWADGFAPAVSWKIPEDIVKGEDYFVKVTEGLYRSKTGYSGMFSIVPSTTQPSITSAVINPSNNLVTIKGLNLSNIKSGSVMCGSSTYAMGFTLSDGGTVFKWNNTDKTEFSLNLNVVPPVGLCVVKVVDTNNAASNSLNFNVLPSQVKTLYVINNAGKASLSWTRVEGMNTYNVFRSNLPGVIPDYPGRGVGLILQGNISGYEDDTVTSGTYYYRVAAQDNNGVVGAASSEISITFPTTSVGTSTVSYAMYHSSDYNHDWKISATEVTRTIKLYNQGGYYKVDPTSIDGFATSTIQSAATTGYHSADYNHDWKIDANEMQRVQYLYTQNYYKVKPTSIDGFDGAGSVINSVSETNTSTLSKVNLMVNGDWSTVGTSMQINCGSKGYVGTILSNSSSTVTVDRPVTDTSCGVIVTNGALQSATYQYILKSLPPISATNITGSVSNLSIQGPSTLIGSSLVVPVSSGLISPSSLTTVANPLIAPTQTPVINSTLLTAPIQPTTVNTQSFVGPMQVYVKISSPTNNSVAKFAGPNTPLNVQYSYSTYEAANITCRLIDSNGNTLNQTIKPTQSLTGSDTCLLYVPKAGQYSIRMIMSSRSTGIYMTEVVNKITQSDTVSTLIDNNAATVYFTLDQVLNIIKALVK
jgi:Putative peptidoglycan binding domain